MRNSGFYSKDQSGGRRVKWVDGSTEMGRSQESENESFVTYFLC